MIQLSCETDFVAKTSQFQAGLKGILQTIHSQQDLRVSGDKGVDPDFLANLTVGTKMINSLDPDMDSQTIEDGIKYTIAKTQENCQLVNVFQTQWNPSEGDVIGAYIHGQTAQGSGMGKIGSIIHMTRQDQLSGDDEFQQLASNLAMHIAAMKPSFLKQEDIPDSLKQEILESEKGKKALREFIRRDVLWEQDLATSQKSIRVNKFMNITSKKMKTKLKIDSWALFQIK